MSIERDHYARDTRGILDPGRMQAAVDFRRWEPCPELAEVVEHFWAVAWDRAPGDDFVQRVLSHPSANLSVGTASTRWVDSDHIDATAVGVCTRVDERRLRGRGWNVAAKLRPGALGLLVPDASALTDRIVPMSEVIAEADEIVGSVVAQEELDARKQVLERALVSRLAPATGSDRFAAARQVMTLAETVQRDRSVRTVADLAAIGCTTPRTLQRLFREHLGASPLWVIRRHRLIDAAEAARDGRPPSWSELARELGYSDQSHLTRDFRAAIGTSPSAYARSVVGLAGRPRP